MERAKGGTHDWEDGVEFGDPYIALFAAIVAQCKRDLTLPVRPRDSTNPNCPSASEVESARDFLQAISASASRYEQS